MNLKNVRIYGFKTFADRTEFSLEGGLVAVVGSNGCGKSNLVDALLWGLGEGNARQLRAATGIDVIFNGSSKRKPLSFAEVQITFDNEDGELPAPTSEVVVSRRLTRGGDSEYRINNTSCRLKDIYELLADSGLGRSGYAIVGQREIDAAVSASPEERRGWIDEAAGVQRYRQRKLEAQRRLVSAEQHLQRTRDVLHELETQREPLREEAEVARKYKDIFGAARSLELSILRRDYVQSVSGIEANSTSREQNAASAGGAKRAEEDSEAQLQAQERRLEQAHASVEALQNSHHELNRAAERNRGDQKLLNLRLEGLTAAEAELTEGRELDTERAAAFKLECDEARSALQEEEAKFSTLLESNSSLGEAVQSIQKELAGIDFQLQSAKRQDAERVKSEAEAAHAKVRLKEIARELAGIASSDQDLQEGFHEAEASAETLRKTCGALQAEREKLRKELTERDGKKRDLQHQLQATLGNHAKLGGRLQGLQMAIESHEGLAHGAKAVIEAAQKGELDGEFTSVGEAIQTPPELALAIDTALGGSVNDLIVERESIAKQAIEWLKSTRKGRVTFQPLSLMKPGEVNRDLRDLASRPKVIGIASELVKVEPRFSSVLASLLNRVLIVEDIDVGLAIAKSDRRCYSRIVTKQGEVIHGSGAVTGGNTQNERGGMVQRKAELNQLQVEVLRLEREVASLEGHLAQWGDEESTLRDQLGAVEDQIREVEPDLKDAESFAVSLKLELAAAEKEKSKLQRESASLATQPHSRPAPINLEPLENARLDLLAKLAVTTAENESFEARFQEQQLRVKQAEARWEMAGRRLDGASLDEAKRAKKLAEIGPERALLDHELSESIKEQDSLQMQLAATQERLEASQAQKVDLQTECTQLQATLAQLRTQQAALLEVSHRLEVERARLESKKANVVERLIEDFDLPEGALGGWTQFEPVEEGADRILAQFKRELKQMGEVNLGAIDAFDRLTTRFDELFVQQDDIEKGIAEINLAISELDLKTKDRFVDALTRVQVAFKRILARLFEGGEGDLVLNDPLDVLNSGIEMDITLPGKRKQQLALLSGGERSLCAMAFLFALLEVKTSPLVVLDEVDAPLDGYNLERYIGLLKEFAAKSQVIVITHNPNTIANCPVWLGVTMKEPGVSTLIPYEMPPESSHQEAESSLTLA